MKRKPPNDRAIELTWKIFHGKVVPCAKSKMKRGYSKHKKKDLHDRY